MDDLWGNSENLYPVTRQLLSTNGVVPIRPQKVNILWIQPLRKVFRTEFAIEQYSKMIEVMKSHPHVNLITLADSDAPIGSSNPMVWANETELIEPIIRWGKSKGIHGFGVSPGNYGDENFAARIAQAFFEESGRAIPVTTYDWPDKEFDSDGKRYSDNNCGLLPLRNLMSRYMRMVPDWFPFCQVGSDQMKKAWDDFVRLCSGMYCVNNMKMMRVGAPVPTFAAIRYSEPDIMRRFGMQLADKETLDLVIYVKGVLEGQIPRPDWFGDLKAEMESIFDFSEVEAEFPDLAAQLTLTLGWIIKTMGETRSNSVTLRCWPELQEQLKMMICQLNGLFYSLGIMSPCETDILGGIMSSLMHGFGIGDKLDLNTLLDYTTILTPTEGSMKILWWHCGTCPHRGMRGFCAGCKVRLRKGWILEATAAGLGDGWWLEKDDTVTFGQIRPDENEDLRVIATRSKVSEGPPTIGTCFYTDFSKEIYDFMMGNIPEHHWSVRAGDYYDLLRKSVKWLRLPGKPAFFDGVIA